MPDENLLPPHENQQEAKPIKFVQSEIPLTFEWVVRHKKMYALDETEVKRLESSNSTLPFVFAGICGGVLASFLSGLLTSSVVGTLRVAISVFMAFGSGLLTIFFLISGIRTDRRDREEREVIKRAKVLDSK